MSLKAFSFWILILTIGILQWYSYVREHFNGKVFYEHRTKVLEAQLRRQEMKTALAYYQLQDFQQSVATILPKASKELGAYQKRTIASIVQAPDSEKLSIQDSSALFEKAKRHFRSEEFDEASDLLKKLIEQFPLSSHVIDSYFLLVESTYQMNELDECADYIDSMVTLFPEHDLTGFALLRMGQIFTSRDRLEDAEQIYNTVINNFKNPEMTEQASKLLKEISL
ncbi:MAG: tol-pal system YbgF family protein [Bdellovibrionales bacterium]